MGPIDYSTQVSDPFSAGLSGFGKGLAISDALDQREAARQQAIALAEQARLQQAQREQMQADINALANNKAPTAQDYVSLGLRYPSMAKQANEAWTALSKEQQDNRWKEISSVGNALESGDNQIAAQLLTDQATALRNAGKEQEARAAESLAKKAIDDPRAARTSINMRLAAVDPDKFSNNLQAIQARIKQDATLPAETVEGKAKADSAVSKAFVDKVSAENAREVTAQQIAKTNEEMTGLQFKRELDRQNLELERAKLQVGNEQKVNELQLAKDKFISENTEKAQAKTAKATADLDTVLIGKQSVKNVLDHPALKSGQASGSLVGSVLARLTGSERADYDSKLEVLKAQQFMQGVAAMKATGGAMGGLTETEGEQLRKANVSLDTKQTIGSQIAALKTIESILNRQESRLNNSGNLAKTGGAFVMNHSKFGVVDEGYINSLLASKKGSTRAQVMEWLQSTSQSGASGQF